MFENVSGCSIKSIFDLDDDGIQPSKRSSFDGQNCSRLAKNPLTASKVGLISFNDDDYDESKTILRRWC